MDDLYSLLRAFADSWFLIFMFALFVGAGIWAFRPGSRPLHDDAAMVPFRHEDRPDPQRPENEART
ncbi:MAG: cbb3-type cytochrome c oxidase subunit 3 [Rubellimicrobium sp.]|nr:cbb3-type cytochrome c oxidase subunit 3 [Rubellimicrobium sp.]